MVFYCCDFELLLHFEERKKKQPNSPKLGCCPPPNRAHTHFLPTSTLLPFTKSINTKRVLQSTFFYFTLHSFPPTPQLDRAFYSFPSPLGDSLLPSPLHQSTMTSSAALYHDIHSFDSSALNSTNQLNDQTEDVTLGSLAESFHSQDDYPQPQRPLPSLLRREDTTTEEEGESLWDEKEVVDGAVGEEDDGLLDHQQHQPPPKLSSKPSSTRPGSSLSSRASSKPTTSRKPIPSTVMQSPAPPTQSQALSRGNDSQDAIRELEINGTENGGAKGKGKKSEKSGSGQQQLTLREQEKVRLPSLSSRVGRSLPPLGDRAILAGKLLPQAQDPFL